MTDSALRVEIALRSAHLAKMMLECMSLSPELVRLQLVDVARELRELQAALDKKGAVA